MTKKSNNSKPRGTPFPKGTSGNLDGAPEKTHWWSQLYIQALERESRKREGYKKKESVVEAVVEKAEEGDMSAVKEIGDRVAGKANQSVDMNVKGTISLVQAISEADE